MSVCEQVMQLIGSDHLMFQKPPGQEEDVLSQRLYCPSSNDQQRLSLSLCRTGEFTLRVADPQLFSQVETVQVQAVSMQVNPRVTDPNCCSARLHHTRVLSGMNGRRRVR